MWMDIGKSMSEPRLREVGAEACIRAKHQMALLAVHVAGIQMPAERT